MTTPPTTSSTFRTEVITNHKSTLNYSLQRTDEVVVLKNALELDLGVRVYPFSVHFISQPFSFVVRLVSPSICSLALPISVLEFTFVYVSISKYVNT
jgi:hypothetical protein